MTNRENRNPRYADFEQHLLDDEPLDPKFWGPPPSRVNRVVTWVSWRWYRITRWVRQQRDKYLP